MELYCKDALRIFFSKNSPLALQISFKFLQKKTRGILGNFSWSTYDDFTLPNGTSPAINIDNLESIHKEFALKCNSLLSIKYILQQKLIKIP